MIVVCWGVTGQSFAVLQNRKEGNFFTVDLLLFLSSLKLAFFDPFDFIWLKRMTKRVVGYAAVLVIVVDQCFSTFFIPCDTLSQQYHFLVAPLDAKIGLKVNESDNWWQPWHYLKAPWCVAPNRLRTTVLDTWLIAFLFASFSSWHKLTLAIPNYFSPNFGSFQNS